MYKVVYSIFGVFKSPEPSIEKIIFCLNYKRIYQPNNTNFGFVTRWLWQFTYTKITIKYIEISLKSLVKYMLGLKYFGFKFIQKILFYL